MSPSAGGSPVRSNVTRRSSVSTSASGEGSLASASSRALTKLSIGLRTHSAPATGGTAGRSGGMNAQCDCHSAPWSIHRRRISISSGSRASSSVPGMTGVFRPSR